HDQPGDTQRASHYLGAQSIGLGFADQRLDRGSNLELIQALERQIQEFQPHVIYTHWWGDVNADHARVAEAVDVAARPYSAPCLKSIYAFETPSSTEWTASARGRAFAPNVFVDISEELDRKLDAMRCYQSELLHPRTPGPFGLCSSARLTGVASPTCRRPRHSRCFERASEHGEALAGRFGRRTVPAPVAERTAGARLRRGRRRVGKRYGVRGSRNSVLAIFAEPVGQPLERPSVATATV